jgi:hypothetical protein
MIVTSSSLKVSACEAHDFMFDAGHHASQFKTLRRYVCIPIPSAIVGVKKILERLIGISE